MILYESSSHVPEHLARQAREIFLNWENPEDQRQRDPDFYRRFNERSIKDIFGTEDMPDKTWFPNDEDYTAYWEELKQDFNNVELWRYPPVAEALENYILPKLTKITGLKKDKDYIYSLTRMPPGGHYRLHKDDWAAKFGFIWYLNTDWKWDWGGLLLTVNDDGSATVKRPIFNNLIITRHWTADNVAHPWHCVTKVEDYVKEPRLSMIGFLK